MCGPARQSSQAPPPPHPHSPSGGVIQHWRTPPTPAPPNLRPTSAACCCRCHCRCAAACYRCKHCGTHHFHPLTVAAVAAAGGCRRFLLHLQRGRSTLSLSPLHGNGHPPPLPADAAGSKQIMRELRAQSGLVQDAESVAASFPEWYHCQCPEFYFACAQGQKKDCGANYQFRYELEEGRIFVLCLVCSLGAT